MNFTKRGRIVIHKIMTDCNEQIAKITATIQNRGVESTRINYTVEINEEIDNLLVQMRMFLPDDKNADNYNRMYFDAGVDVSKIAKSLKGNTLMRMVAAQLIESMDFELKFPWKKVSSVVSFLNDSFSLSSQGIYRLINFQPSDKFAPFLPSTKFLVELRYRAKLRGSKAFVYAWTNANYGEKI